MGALSGRSALISAILSSSRLMNETFKRGATVLLIDWTNLKKDLSEIPSTESAV